MNFIDPQIGKPRCSTKKKNKPPNNDTVIARNSQVNLYATSKQEQDAQKTVGVGLFGDL